MKIRKPLLISSIVGITLLFVWMVIYWGADEQERPQRAADTLWVSQPLKGFLANDLGYFSCGRVLVGGSSESDGEASKLTWILLDDDGAIHSVHSSSIFPIGYIWRVVVSPDGNSAALLGHVQRPGDPGVVMLTVDSAGAVLQEARLTELPHNAGIEAVWLSDGSGLAVAVNPTGVKRAGGADVVVVKVDRAANVLWRESISGEGLDAFYSSTPLAIAEIGDGACVVSLTSDSGDLGVPKGEVAVFSSCFDGQGNVLWTDVFSRGDDSELRWEGALHRVKPVSQMLIGVARTAPDEIAIIAREDVNARSLTSSHDADQVTRRVNIRRLTSDGKSSASTHLDFYSSSPAEHVARHTDANFLVFEASGGPHRRRLRIVSLGKESVGDVEHVMTVDHGFPIAVVPVDPGRLLVALRSSEKGFSTVRMVRIEGPPSGLTAGPHDGGE